MNKEFWVRIDCYRDKDEAEISYCVEADHEEIAARMRAALENGMLPVLYKVGRKYKPVETPVEAAVEAPVEADQDEEADDRKSVNEDAEEEAHVAAGRRLQEIATQVREKLKDATGMWLPLTPGTVPLVLEWKYDNVEFRAAGLGEDVLDAQEEFLEGVFEE